AASHVSMHAQPGPAQQSSAGSGHAGANSRSAVSTGANASASGGTAAKAGTGGRTGTVPPSAPPSPGSAGRGDAAGASMPAPTFGGSLPALDPSFACAQIRIDPSLSGSACNNAHDKCFVGAGLAKLREISSKCATGALLTPAMKSCLAYAVMPDAPEAKQCFL